MFRFARVFGRPARAVQSKEHERPNTMERAMSLLKKPMPRKVAPLFSAAETCGKRRAEAVLDALLRKAATEGEFSEVVDITPEMAEMLLSRNAQNRTVRQKIVDSIAQEIKEGRWALNGETLIVANDGSLNDGQHRCHAVVKAGRSIRSFVTFGVPRETRQTVDSEQNTRTPGDFVTMDGIADGNHVAAVAGYLWQIDRFGEIPRTSHAPGYRPTKQQVNEVVETRLAEIREALSAAPSKGSAKVASRSVLAIAYLLISKADPAAARNYIARVIDGADLSTKSPIYVVRERLIDEKRKRSVWPHKQVELLLRGWLAHRGRKTGLSKLQYMGSWPKIGR